MSIAKSCFELADLLLLIGIEGRTGELVIESGNNIGSLLFHQGNILVAFSPYTKAIGDKLVDLGFLTEAELLSALKEQRSGPPLPLGCLLIRSGKVKIGIIQQLVHEQVRNAIMDFNSWKPVEFNFIIKDIQPVDSIHLTVHDFIPGDMKRRAQKFIQRMGSGE
ncbi:MAG: DUF4388 domain-containing protein [Nitrospirota bacterium]|nr:DUF4388 domain-containing protein [Nitrospirota bacterium]